MADFSPKTKKVTPTLDYEVAVDGFSDGTEQRRLTQGNEIYSFVVETPSLEWSDFDTYRAFYESKKGRLISFTYDYRSVTYTVRFNEQLRWVDDENNRVTVTFNLKVLN